MTWRGQWRASWTDPRDRFGLLLVLLIAILLLTGVSSRRWVGLAAGILNLAAFIVGFRTTRSQFRLWTMAGILLAGFVGAILVSTIRADEPGAALGALAQVVLLGTLTVAVLARVATHERVSIQTIMGAIAAYMLIGQTFAWAYLALPGFEDESVIVSAPLGQLPLYYSYVVLTTLGFGDIVPTTAIAQRITVLEALIGQIYLVVTLARLVSVYSASEHPPPPLTDSPVDRE